MDILAIHTDLGDTEAVILTVPDAGLAELLASPVLLAQMWPGAGDEVKVLIQVLRMSVPSLAATLAVGLLTLLTPPAGKPTSEISLAYNSAVVRAIAQSDNGHRVTAPLSRPSEVWRLEIVDLAVGGRSGLRLAG